MLARVGDVLFALGLLVVVLTGAAFLYLVEWGEGPGAEMGRLMVGTIFVIALLSGTAIRFVLRG
ncbi:MAG: hypothetical protein WD034_09440 [Parvibaculum sp.]